MNFESGFRKIITFLPKFEFTFLHLLCIIILVEGGDIMKQVENNAFFWQKLDSLYFSSSIVIERPKNSKHPRFADLVYPVDYGFLKDSLASDGAKIDVFVGSQNMKRINSIVITTDILKRECEVKLLIGCNEEEEHEIMHMLNLSENQKAILLRRSSDIGNFEDMD